MLHEHPHRISVETMLYISHKCLIINGEDFWEGKHDGSVEFVICCNFIPRKSTIFYQVFQSFSEGSQWFPVSFWRIKFIRHAQHLKIFYISHVCFFSVDTSPEILLLLKWSFNNTTRGISYLFHYTINNEYVWKTVIMIYTTITPETSF